MQMKGYGSTQGTHRRFSPNWNGFSLLFLAAGTASGLSISTGKVPRPRQAFTEAFKENELHTEAWDFYVSH